jgi:hypothetical protein
MKKIRTIFVRDEHSRRVVDQYDKEVDLAILQGAQPTEKLDGMNVRLTVRNHTLVRLEKRRNPTKIQKHKGIIHPWYVDTSESKEDQYLVEAAKNTDLSDVPDGEWSGEAIGPKIQGNPLGLERHTVVLFSLGKAPLLENVPTYYAGLQVYLPQQMSALNATKPIEGIVWHGKNGDMFKIKSKDF